MPAGLANPQLGPPSSTKLHHLKAGGGTVARLPPSTPTPPRRAPQAPLEQDRPGTQLRTWHSPRPSRGSLERAPSESMTLGAQLQGDNEDPGHLASWSACAPGPSPVQASPLVALRWQGRRDFGSRGGACAGDLPWTELPPCRPLVGTAPTPSRLEGRAFFGQEVRAPTRLCSSDRSTWRSPPACGPHPPHAFLRPPDVSVVAPFSFWCHYRSCVHTRLTLVF